MILFFSSHGKLNSMSKRNVELRKFINKSIIQVRNYVLKPIQLRVPKSRHNVHSFRRGSYYGHQVGDVSILRF